MCSNLSAASFSLFSVEVTGYIFFRIVAGWVLQLSRERGQWGKNAGKEKVPDAGSEGLNQELGCGKFTYSSLLKRWSGSRWVGLLSGWTRLRWCGEQGQNKLWLREVETWRSRFHGLHTSAIVYFAWCNC